MGDEKRQVLKRSGVVGGLAAAALAAMAGMPNPMPAPVAQSVVQQAVATGQRVPATQAPTTARSQIDQALHALPLVSLDRRHGPIWNGVAKRGNRRGRSRWNYNR